MEEKIMLVEKMCVLKKELVKQEKVGAHSTVDRRHPKEIQVWA